MAKRTVGEQVEARADVFCDGHDAMRAVVHWRRRDEEHAHEHEMRPLVNDRWEGTFPVDEQGVYEFTVEAWVDRYESWARDIKKKADAGQDVSVDLLAGAQLIEEWLDHASAPDAALLREAAATVSDESATIASRLHAGLDEQVRGAMRRSDPRRHVTKFGAWLPIRVDRERARFSAWYELFPRSMAEEPGRHGTFRDVEAKLPHVRRLGFDVLYLPPIHPIGISFRKGRNNALEAGPDDVGSPWAIGGAAGGHDAIHPELGTMEDFDRLVRAAREHDMEIALDIAFQCSPDHPWVKEHPEWFRKRADGSIQYAENPPKKYQDIYPIDFESNDWENLWRGLRDVMLFWVKRGVKIFRVDNPHTKAFGFWEWAIADIKDTHPDVLFLSEAFTRPKLMYRLAKLGFTQSYTYFAWRDKPWEIEQYYRELTSEPVVDFFRPNAWPNTPDILTATLQHAGRPALMGRLVLAATLCASYGVYGPPYEAGDVRAREPGSEEYLDSEKYQLRHWDFSRPQMMTEFMARVNRIRRDHPSLSHDRTLRFHRTDNPNVIAYSKSTPDGRDPILVIVNTDFRNKHWAHTDLDLEALGLREHEPFEVHDLLTNARYTWTGRRNVVGLDPAVAPAHVFELARAGRTERDRDEFA